MHFQFKPHWLVAIVERRQKVGIAHFLFQIKLNQYRDRWRNAYAFFEAASARLRYAKPIPEIRLVFPANLPQCLQVLGVNIIGRFAEDVFRHVKSSRCF